MTVDGDLSLSDVYDGRLEEGLTELEFIPIPQSERIMSEVECQEGEYDFGMHPPEELSKEEKERWTNKHEIGGNLDYPVYKVGEQTLPLSKVFGKTKCDPYKCDCFVLTQVDRITGKTIPTYYNDGKGFNCVGFALGLLVGIDSGIYIRVDEVKKSLLEILGEHFSGCVVNCGKYSSNWYYKLLEQQDVIRESNFDAKNPNFGHESL